MLAGVAAVVGVVEEDSAAAGVAEGGGGGGVVEVLFVLVLVVSLVAVYASNSSSSSSCRRSCICMCMWRRRSVRADTADDRTAATARSDTRDAWRHCTHACAVRASAVPRSMSAVGGGVGGLRQMLLV